MINKFLFLIFIIFSFYTYAYSQVKIDENVEDYNRLSIELNIGQNKLLRPFSDGYYSSNPNKFMNLTGNFHFDGGIQYMLTNVFGFKSNLGFDEFKNINGSGSLFFKSDMYSLDLEGVINMSRILRFETFSQRFALVCHAGFQVAKFYNSEGHNSSNSEWNGGVKIGFTPQVRLSDKIALTIDFSIFNNLRQHLNWDGGPSSSNQNLLGLYFVNSFGVKYYFGKNGKNAEWFLPDDSVSYNKNYQEELNKLKKDTDNDGIPDYRDEQSNTPYGVGVDRNGKFIDKNINDVPDDLESYVNQNVLDIVSHSSLSEGQVNIYFELNSDNIRDESLVDLYNCVKFLRANKVVNIQLTGYADERGGITISNELKSYRVSKVYDMFIRFGINQKRIIIKNDSNRNDQKGDTPQRVTIEIMK